MRIPAVFLVATVSLQAHAAPDERVRGEIEYLLTYLEISGCKFFRNGNWYDSSRARQHIERKYVWLLKRDMVASTEQFIEHAASQSSLSGQPYQVRCAQNQSVPSAEWLTEVLTHHRNAGSVSVPE
jgi:hypothetical protein